MVSPQEITKEEMYAYWIVQGKNKTEAYRLIREIPSTMSNDTVKALAWQYSNRPEVISILANEQDNSYIKYMKMRTDVMSNLFDIAMNGSSERAQIDSSATILQHTAKLAKNSIDITVNNNEMNVMLEDLRSVLLSPPIEYPQDIKTLEVIPTKNLETFEKREGLYLGDVPLTRELLEEQENGINPLSNKNGDKHSRIQDYSTGKFVTYEDAHKFLDTKES